MSGQKLNRRKLDPTIPDYTGDAGLIPVNVQLFSYNQLKCKELTNVDIETVPGFDDQQYQHWLNFHGIHQTEQVVKIARKIGLHHLSVQDILDINQRPKLQEYQDYWVLHVRTFSVNGKETLKPVQISFVLGRNYVISFQEKKADFFEHIREGLRVDAGVVRSKTVDYLLFLMLESILDQYFVTIQLLEKKVDKFRVLQNSTSPNPNLMQQIEDLRNQLYTIKRSLNPINDYLIKVERAEGALIKPHHLKYFVELRDLCLSTIDDCDQLQHQLESYVNLFFSVQGHNMNQIMKMLTIVTTIFIPLTFLAGIYGMNFIHMPELEWKYGYAGLWGVFIILVSLMVWYFRRKKWF